MIVRQISEISESESFKKNLVENKNSFVLTKSTFYEQFLFGNIRYDFSNAFKSFRELSLMSQFKKQVKANAHKCSAVDVRKIKYFDYSKKTHIGLEPGEVRVFKKCIEIDISAAYLYAFLNYGLIDETLFNKIIALQKFKRLPIMGAIASIKEVSEYVNGVKVSTEILKNDELRNAWFFVSLKIDEMLNQCVILSGNDYLFYYVDGIYFNANEALKNKIINYFKNKNFKSNTVICEKIEVINKGDLFNLKVFKSGIIKNFNFLPDKIKYIYDGH
jgi:hypothetical protein